MLSVIPIPPAGQPVSVSYRWRCEIGILIQLHLFDEGFLRAHNYWVCWPHLLSCWGRGQLSFIYYLPSEECGLMTKWPPDMAPLSAPDIWPGQGWAGLVTLLEWADQISVGIIGEIPAQVAACLTRDGSSHYNFLNCSQPTLSLILLPPPTCHHCHH